MKNEILNYNIDETQLVFIYVVVICAGQKSH